MLRSYIHKVIAEEDLPFSKMDYSAFKHGCRNTSDMFGAKLAHQLADTFLKDIPKDTAIMMTGAPYNQVPVASTALCVYTVMELRNLGFSNIKEFKIDREHSYHQDYGLMNAEDRKKSITGESFYTDASILKDKVVIFVDDILITGAHESRIVDMIASLNITPSQTCFAYYAYLEPGCCEPDIEHNLNSWVTCHVRLLTDLFEDSYPILNTRVVKHMLRLTEQDFLYLISRITGETRRELYRYGLANNYHSHELYAHNFSLLKYDH